MEYPALQIAKNCFLCTLLIGLFLVIFGIAVIPVTPYFQSSNLLIPEESTDPETRERMLELLKDAQGNQRGFWITAGLVIAGLSLGGLISLKQLTQSIAAQKRAD